MGAHVAGAEIPWKFAEGYTKKWVFLKKHDGRWFFWEHIYCVISLSINREIPPDVCSDSVMLAEDEFLLRQLSGPSLRPMEEILYDADHGMLR